MLWLAPACPSGGPRRYLGPRSDFRARIGRSAVLAHRCRLPSCRSIHRTVAQLGAGAGRTCGCQRRGSARPARIPASAGMALSFAPMLAVAVGSSARIPRLGTTGCSPEPRAPTDWCSVDVKGDRLPCGSKRSFDRGCWRARSSGWPPASGYSRMRRWRSYGSPSRRPRRRVHQCENGPKA